MNATQLDLTASVTPTPVTAQQGAGSLYRIYRVDHPRLKTFALRFEWGISVYRERYGVRPRAALVNAEDFKALGVIDGIDVRVGGSVAPREVWLSVEENR